MHYFFALSYIDLPLDENGPQTLFSEYVIESYYSILDVSVEDIMEIYHMHRTCEQFHSELKTDMDIERMPFGKFATNDLLLHIAMFCSFLTFADII